MKVGERIKRRREVLGISQQELADRLGLKDKSSISRMEGGEPRPETIEKVAAALNCSVAFLMGWEKGNRVPVLGNVPAGIPIEAIEDVIDYEEVDERLASIGELFGLRIKGNSMEPRICNGDTVIVHKQPEAENGDTVIATINGDDAVCKKLYVYGDTVLLRSTNPAYEDINVTGRKDFHILGKVVELRGKFQ